MIPQTVFSCRGSGGFGREAGGPYWPPGAERGSKFVVKIIKKSLKRQKLHTFCYFLKKKRVLAERGINF